MSGMILTGTTTAVSTSTQRSGIVDSCRRRRNHAVLLLLCKVIPWIARRPARRRLKRDDAPGVVAARARRRVAVGRGGSSLPAYCLFFITLLISKNKNLMKDYRNDGRRPAA